MTNNSNTYKPYYQRKLKSLGGSNISLILLIKLKRIK